MIWGGDWDKLFERDHTGLLLKRMEECVDGDFQAYKAKDGAYLRREFFGKYPELLELVRDYTDDELIKLHRGGHDRGKVFNAYKRAVEHTSGPTVILAKTVKGYGLGSTQARNASHQEKKLTDDAISSFVETKRRKRRRKHSLHSDSRRSGKAGRKPLEAGPRLA